eukprot:TRINITY_DN66784_c6_g2_i1.p1 TRINITY_DN66784_c6_g2~~TRINITY_DN66784_c6_g2_i1.p1  ORF type:complete len:185 (-),score=16.91 TRINITY_DN66784_c6_g2_i1:207-761(-)
MPVYKNDPGHIWFRSTTANGFVFLSNFWPSVPDESKAAVRPEILEAPFKLVIKGKEWPTVEHYFQAEKWKAHPKISADIAAQPTALDAKKRNGFWKKSESIDVDQWHKTRFGIMEVALRAKFDPEQNPTLAQALMDTAGRELAEDPGKFTGDTWTGGQGNENGLGKLLMMIREELIAAQANEAN